MLDNMATNWPDASTEQAASTIAVQRLARQLERIATEALVPFDLTPAEFELLSALRALPAPQQLTPTALYDAMLISSGGLTKLLKGLEMRNLVVRIASETDRRSRLVALTPEGHALTEQAMAAVQRAEAPLHRAMKAAWSGKAGRTGMARGLAAIADAADEAMR